MNREVRYCTTEDGVTIAYAVSGHGERWFVHTPNYASAAIQFDRTPPFGHRGGGTPASTCAFGHDLKGIEEPVRVFAVRAEAS